MNQLTLEQLELDSEWIMLENLRLDIDTMTHRVEPVCLVIFVVEKDVVELDKSMEVDKNQPDSEHKRSTEEGVVVERKYKLMEDLLNEV